MAKKRNDYFKLVLQQVEYCVKASDLLEEIFCDFSAEGLGARRERMHIIENDADQVHHDILACLSTEFITPIDQEDIFNLVKIIDDVTDALDEVVLELYMFHISEIPSFAPELSKVVNRCVKALDEAVGELKSFKRPEALRDLLVEVNNIESEADGIYSDAIFSLFENSSDSRTLIGHKAVYDSLENCCDLCEHAADVLDRIIIKNS